MACVICVHVRVGPTWYVVARATPLPRSNVTSNTRLIAAMILPAGAVGAGPVAVAGRAARAAVEPVGLQIHAVSRRAAGVARRARAGAGAADLHAHRAAAVAHTAVTLAGARVDATPVAVDHTARATA